VSAQETAARGGGILKGYLFVTVFLSGASLMSLEMASFRLVQPEFGSDIIVWGSLISVFLGGMALGAFFGGKLADRAPRAWILGIVLILSGLSVAFLQFYSDSVFSLFSSGNQINLRSLGIESPDATQPAQAAVQAPPDMRFVTLGAAAIMFLVPTLLIGMVSPFSARLLIRNLPKLGSGIGMISAVSTFGSIIGTLGSTFYLIQFLGTRMLMSANGILLSVLGLAALAVTQGMRKAAQAA
jgi:MFS family permease